MVSYYILVFLLKYAYKAEPYVASEYKTVHEELAKSMTTILKPSADFLTSNKLLKVYIESYFLLYVLICRNWRLGTSCLEIVVGCLWRFYRNFSFLCSIHGFSLTF